MSPLEDRLTAVYDLYVLTRFIKKRSMNMKMSKKEYIAATINEFRQEINTIVRENISSINKKQVPEMEKFVMDIISKFELAVM
jgi:uncharacterized protein (UPF0305 family)